MLCGGDECGRTQLGNNNAYCQDNEISWTHWDWDEHAQRLQGFTSRLIHFRNDHPIFRRPKFFQGRKIRGSEIKDIMWFNPGGTEMNDDEWTTSFVRTLGMLLGGDTIDVRDEHGEPIRDDTFLILINSHHEPVNFALPGEEDVKWELLLDTRLEEGFPAMPEDPAKAGDEFALMERSFALFRLSTGEHAHARTESWKKRQPKPAEPTPDAAAVTAAARRPEKGENAEKPGRLEKPAKTKASHEKRPSSARR
jgi:glycogen operon protein